MLHHRRVPSPLARLGLTLAASAVLLLGLAPALIAAGPPFPSPVDGQQVYDTAGVLKAPSIALAQQRIGDIKRSTGAEIAVYTQLVPGDTTTDDAKAQALALMNQWGVGRKGFDDGLVILFDMYQGNTCHGQVFLYGGSGFNAAYVSADGLQLIYQAWMLPKLRTCDVSGALDAAMAVIAVDITPERAAQLESARQINAVLGLVLAPLAAIVLIGGGLLLWWRRGKDPVYLDDDSIHLPAPPANLTPAAGAAIRDGGAQRRAMTAASLDLAVRGLVSFKSEPPPAYSTKPGLGVYTGSAVTGDQAEQMRMSRARSRPMDPATEFLGRKFDSTAGAQAYLPADRMSELARDVPEFNRRLEAYLVEQGWYRAAPSAVVTKWVGVAVLLFIVGVVLVVLGFAIPSSGALLLGVSLGVSSVALGVIGAAMPSRTKDGAVIYAMLAAYRRTLEKTMAQARSMTEVATQAAIPMIESPDDAVAWGVALGLNEEVEAVLGRSAQDRAAGRDAYLPAWFIASQPYYAGSSLAGGSGGLAPGLMSSSPIPDFGSMTAALGTIGAPPPSAPSSGSSGGGFSGGFGGGRRWWRRGRGRRLLGPRFGDPRYTPRHGSH